MYFYTANKKQKAEGGDFFRFYIFHYEIKFIASSLRFPKEEKWIYYQSARSVKSA